MRRRLLVTIVVSVALALVLAGLGTYLLAELGARRYAEDQLRTQVEAMAETWTSDDPRATMGGGQSRLRAAIRAALRLEGVAFLIVGPDGALRGRPPDGIMLGDREVDRLVAGETISGREGELVYAGSTFHRGESEAAVILSDRISIALGGGVVWFVLAGAVVLAMSVVAAFRLSRRLTEPLVRAGQASRRIAGGDLSARVPDPPDADTGEVADLTRSINSMAAALERSRALEQQFLLSVSHDLRTPLTSIRGYAEALTDGTTTDGARAGRVILAESRRLQRLVDDLLELARLDARAFSLHPRSVEVDRLVETVVDGFAPEVEAAGVAVEVAADHVVATVDPDRLAQMVANLLDNALTYASSRVVVGVEQVADRLRVSVQDDGPGIDEADRDRVFQRLYTDAGNAGNARRRESGSGLGLAIVWELVLAMGGTTEAVRSRIGGAEISFELPLA